MVTTDRLAAIKIYARANTDEFSRVIPSEHVKLIINKLSPKDVPTLRTCGDGVMGVVSELLSVRVTSDHPDTWPLKQKFEDKLFDISSLDTGLKGYTLRDLHRLPKVGKDAALSVYPTKTCTVFADNNYDPRWVAASMPLNSIAVNQDKYATHKERIQL